jgi:hypothetical protein
MLWKRCEGKWFFRLTLALFFAASLMLATGLAFGGCAANDGGTDEAGEATSFTPFAEGLNYEEQGNWYSLPESPTADIDVFVVYPTVVDDEEEAPYVMDVNSPKLAADVQFFTERSLAPILDGLDVNVYIPKYRQFNASGYMGTYFIKANNDYLSYPRADIYNAYDYYLNNLSNRRDHIVISHSQGSALALMLLSDYAGKYEPKEMRSRMKAAYMPGWGLTDTVLMNSPYLATTTPDDVNTLISWNAATEEEATGDYDRFTWGNETTRSTNPVSWTADAKRVSAKDNPTSIVDDKNGGVKREEFWTGAKVVRPTDMGGTFAGEVVLIDRKASEWLTKDEKTFLDDINLGSAHCQDLQFFAGSIRENIKQRVGVKEKEGAKVEVS